MTAKTKDPGAEGHWRWRGLEHGGLGISRRACLLDAKRRNRGDRRIGLEMTTREGTLNRWYSCRRVHVRHFDQGEKSRAEDSEVRE